jgi:hypothetical protein
VGLALLTMAVAALLCFVLAWGVGPAAGAGPGAARPAGPVDRVLAVAARSATRAALAAPLLSAPAAVSAGGPGRWAVWRAWLVAADGGPLCQAWATGSPCPGALMLLAHGLALLARTALGLVLATLWLSPLILLTMVASAWLKRWGLPALVAALALLAGVLDKLLRQPRHHRPGPAPADRCRPLVRGRPQPGLGLRFTPGQRPGHRRAARVPRRGPPATPGTGVQAPGRSGPAAGAGRQRRRASAC